MKTFAGTFRILRINSALSDAGFSLSAADIPGTSGGPPPDSLHPTVVFENHAARLMGELVRSLSAGVMRKVVWWRVFRLVWPLCCASVRARRSYAGCEMCAKFGRRRHDGKKSSKNLASPNHLDGATLCVFVAQAASNESQTSFAIVASPFR